MGEGMGLPIFGGAAGGQPAIVEEVQPPPFDINKCFRVGVFAPTGAIYFWFAHPHDPEEPKIEVSVDRINRMTGQRVDTIKKKVSRTELQVMQTFDLSITRAYSCVTKFGPGSGAPISEVKIHREVTISHMPYILEMAEKPPWWKDRDKGDKDAPVEKEEK